MLKTAQLGEYTLTFSNASMYYADRELRKIGAPSVMKSAALLLGSIFAVVSPLLKYGQGLSVEALDGVDLDAPEVQQALDKVDFVVINIILWGFMRPKHKIGFEEALDGPLSELSPIESIKVLVGLIGENMPMVDVDEDNAEESEKN